MAVAFRAAGSAATFGASPSTPGLPAGLTSGDLLLLTIAAVGAANTPSGYTLLGGTTDAGSSNYAFFYRVAGGSEVAPSCSWASSNGTAILSAYSGVDPVTPIDSHGAATSTPSPSGTAVSFPGVTTSFIAGAFLVGLLSTQFNKTVTAGTQQIGGAAATLDVNVTNAFDFHAWHLQQGSPGASGAGTATLSASGTGVGMVVALRPPNPFTRPAYQFGATQGVNRASTY